MEPSPILYLQRNAGRSGAPESLLHLLRYLDRDRFTPSVVCGQEGWLVDTLREMDVPVVVASLPAWSKPSRLLSVRRTVNELARGFAQRKIELVHANEHILAPYAVLLGRRLRAARVCHVRWHNLNRRRVWEYLYPWLDRIIVVSDDAGHRLYRTRATRGKTVTIYNGISQSAFENGHDRDAVRAGLGLSSSDTLLIQVGTLCPRKNQTWMLPVLRELLSRHPRMHLLLVGEADEGYMMQIQRLAATLEVADRVYCLGVRHDVPRLLAASDVFVFPTQSEGFPRAVLEAMGAGLPVVASNIGPHREAIVTGESGILAPLGDLNAWSRAIHRLLENPVLRQRLADGGRLRVTERYTARQTSLRVARLYHDLLGKPNDAALATSADGTRQ